LKEAGMGRNFGKAEGGQWVTAAAVVALSSIALMAGEARAESCQPGADSNSCTTTTGFSACPDGTEIVCACQGTLYACNPNEFPAGAQDCDASRIRVLDLALPSGCYSCGTSGKPCPRGAVWGLERCANPPDGDDGNLCRVGRGECRRTGARVCGADKSFACSVEPGTPTKETCGTANNCADNAAAVLGPLGFSITAARRTHSFDGLGPTRLSTPLGIWQALTVPRFGFGGLTERGLEVLRDPGAGTLGGKFPYEN
jgi:hypothetical protein